MNFEVLDEAIKSEDPVSIVVIGAGGGGSNAVNGMIERGIRGVKFVAVIRIYRPLEATRPGSSSRLERRLPEAGEREAYPRSANSPLWRTRTRSRKS